MLLPVGRLLLACILLIPLELTASELPQLTGRVNDYAAMLSPDTSDQLENRLATFEQEQSTQIVILTVMTLGGVPLEEFSLKVAEKWQIGQQGRDNGALLLVARNEREVRIEVGYGLEGSLTDLAAGRIIRHQIIPHFKQGKFDLGILNGAQAMMEAVNGEFSTDESSGSGESPDIGGFAVMLAAVLFFIGKAFGKNRVAAATIGGLAAPLLGYFILGAEYHILVILVILGVAGGLIASTFSRTSRRAGKRSSGSHIYSRPGGSGGGFGGGFSGGGGGFGGGGASGDW